MSDVPIQAVIAAYPNGHGADDALDELQQAELDGVIRIRDAKIVRRDARGKLTINDATPHPLRRGATLGGISGAVVGLLTGPVGWDAGAGAVFDGVASRLRQCGISPERLHGVSDAMQPGSSALVALVEQTWLDELVHQLGNASADFVTAGIQPDVATQLEAVS